ncbi:MAG TPA: aminotransferase class IV [Urbifossiella sp.]|jgi:branched-subunit amino acid aminotransferase/4-amino-4-deoxychorismate lyase|nr:aminotransferase class IV [Urbifossiella sp.]
MADQGAGASDDFGWADPDLRQRLLTDPAAALAVEGVAIPPGMPARVVTDVVRIVWLLWVDGQLVPRGRFHIDPNDEGLLFGRGVWESTRTVGGVPWLWDLHLDRLRRTAALLDIPLDPARLPAAAAVSDYVRALTAMDVVIRLNVSAGRAGRPGTVWMSAALPPAKPVAVSLKSAPTPVPPGQPQLTWKTFQYSGRLRVGQDAAKAGFDSALLLDPNGNLLEAAHANLFIRLPDGWATPTAGDGLFLPGTVRRHLLDRSPVVIREQVVHRTLLGEVQEAFVTNSSVGIVPVARIDDRTYPVGEETMSLARWLEPKAPGGPDLRFVRDGQ